MDHSGGSRFRGKIDRATVFRGRLKPDVIRMLAEGNRSGKPAHEGVIDCRIDPQTGDVLTTQPGDLEGALSFEAWIQPEKGEAGRIFDKITAGKGDGFLIDCWPGLSLRVIIGPHQEDFPDVLQPGVWQHIAVVIRKGQVAVYLNGDKL